MNNLKKLKKLGESLGLVKKKKVWPKVLGGAALVGGAGYGLYKWITRKKEEDDDENEKKPGSYS